MTNKNYEDMLAGRPHDGGDPYLFELKTKAAAAKAKLDAIPNEDFPARIAASQDLFAEGSGPAVQFITDTHPVKPEERFLPADGDGPLPFKVVNYAPPITVEDYAWIGAGSIILPGVTIGTGAVVGAGSVVTKDVAPRMIVGGNPARVLRSVDD